VQSVRTLRMAGVAVLLAALGVSAATLLRKPAEERPRVVFAEVEHDFGTVEQGTRVSHAFALRNDAQVPLSIARVDLSQPAMKSRFQRVVAPGDEGRIVVEWDTTRVRGELAANAVVHLDDPEQPTVTLSLKGNSVASIEIEPAPVTFFSVYRDEAAEQRVTIINREERPLAITGIETEGTHFAAKLETIEAGKRYDVVVTVPRGQPAGRYREALTVVTDNVKRSRLAVGVNVFVKDDLYATPEVVQFDDVSLAQLRQPQLADGLKQTVTLRKRDGEFRITGMSTDVKGVTLAATPSGEASASFQLVVGLSGGIVRPGSLDGVIRVATDDKFFPEVVIPVRGIAR
jgi:hypothetical protein